MPYKTPKELPSDVQEALPGKAQSIFMDVVNSVLAKAPKDEQGAFQQAWAAVKNAGYKKDAKTGKWCAVAKGDDQAEEIAKAQDGGYLPEGSTYIASEGESHDEAIREARMGGDRWCVVGDLLYDVRHARLGKSLPGSVLPIHKSDHASAVFVTYRPDSVEAMRRELLTGDVGARFEKEYLSPMQLGRDDVAVLPIVPVFITDDNGRPRDPTASEAVEWIDCFAKELASHAGAPVFAMGERAAEVLGPKSELTLPHPACIKKDARSLTALRNRIARVKLLTFQKHFDDHGPRSRTNLGDAIDVSGQSMADDLGPPILVAKADGTQGIVGAVTARPRVPDAEDDVLTATEVENTAYAWARRGFPVRFRHDRFDKEGNPGSVEIHGGPLETFIARADDDAGNPRPIGAPAFHLGKEQVLVGDHVVFMQYDDDWAREKIDRGEVNAFSWGGNGSRRKIKVPISG